MNIGVHLVHVVSSTSKTFSIEPKPKRARVEENRLHAWYVEACMPPRDRLDP